MDQEESPDVTPSVRLIFKSAKYPLAFSNLLLAVLCVLCGPPSLDIHVTQLVCSLGEYMYTGYQMPGTNRREPLRSAAPVVVIALSSEDEQPVVNNQPILLSSFAAGERRAAARRGSARRGAARCDSVVTLLISHLPCCVECRRLLMKASLHGARTKGCFINLRHFIADS